MTITQAIRRSYIDLTGARDNLSNAILTEMVTVARRSGIDSMCFGMAATYERNGEEVPSAELDELDQYYCDHVHSGGFQALWSAKKGWH